MKALENIPQLLQIRGSLLCVYNDFSYLNINKRYNENSRINLSNRNDKKGFSKKAIKTLSSYLQIWYNCVDAHVQHSRNYKKEFNRYMTFVTLTLSSQQTHTDKEIKRQCFDRFITYSKRKFGLSTYVWCCEPQENGNIHFHIVFDRFVDHSSLRSLWNDCQNVLGYVDKFKEKHGHDNPNSTDIHSLRKINYIDRYLCKYMSKNECRRSIDGALWGCSDNLKDLKPFRCEIGIQEGVLLDKLLLKSNIRKKDSDWFYLFCNVKLSDINDISADLYNYVTNYYNDCFHQLYDTESIKKIKNELGI